MHPIRFRLPQTLLWDLTALPRAPIAALKGPTAGGKGRKEVIGRGEGRKGKGKRGEGQGRRSISCFRALIHCLTERFVLVYISAARAAIPSVNHWPLLVSCCNLNSLEFLDYVHVQSAPSISTFRQRLKHSWISRLSSVTSYFLTSLFDIAVSYYATVDLEMATAN